MSEEGSISSMQSSQDSEFETYTGKIEEYTRRRVPTVLANTVIATSSGLKDLKVSQCLNPEEL